MKNKGFTLIEIIAVIIIIGILMIITIPSVSGFLSSSRNSAYKAHEKSMEEAAKSYTIECINNNEQGCYLPREGEEITLLLGELEDKEFLEKLQDPSKQGTYCNPEESYVIIKKSDAIDYEYTACLYCGTYEPKDASCIKIEVNPTTIGCGTDIVGSSNTWTKEPRTISINCVDASGSCKQERFEKTFGTTMEYGDITIYDKNPARGTKNCRVPVRIDLEKPTCSLDVSGDNRGSYYVDNVTVTMPSSSRIDNHSGVGSYGLGTSINNPNYNNRETMLISDNGVTRVFGYIKDIVGNENVCSTNITRVGKYYIIYDKNTGEGTMENTECIFGENCTLRRNTFTKTGYHFNYWSMLANGNTAKHYSDGEVVKNLTFSDTIRLYVIWEKNQNTLVVNANTGNGGFTERHEYEYQKAINVSKVGYSFTGWSASGTCGSYTNSATTTYTYPASRDTTCTLKAGWSINSNTLVVDANGGAGGFTATQNYNTTKAISVSKAHFVFDGWEATGTCGSYNNTVSTTYKFPPDKDTTCTLIAKWKAAPYATITCSDKNYNGLEQTGCSCSGGTIGGDYKGINAGQYTASCTADFYHTDSSNKSWNINKIPALLSCSNKTYTGTEQTGCSCSGGTIGGQYKAKIAGTYTASCTADINHTNPSNENWTIGKISSSISCNTFDYDGKSHNLVKSSNGCASFSNNTRTSAGSQEVTCNGDENHNSSTCVGIINKIASSCSCSDKDYNGSAQTIASGSYCTPQGASQTDAGDYSISCTGDENHKNSSCGTCKINKVAATLSCSDKDYTGREIVGCSCSGGTIKGTYKATNPGTYTAKCTADKNHTSPSDVNWKIVDNEKPVVYAWNQTNSCETRVYYTGLLNPNDGNNPYVYPDDAARNKSASTFTIKNIGSDNYGIKYLKYWTSCNSKKESVSVSGNGENSSATITIDSCPNAKLYYYLEDYYENTSNTIEVTEIGMRLLIAQAYNYLLYPNSCAKNDDNNVSYHVQKVLTYAENNGKLESKIYDHLVQAAISINKNEAWVNNNNSFVARLYIGLLGRDPEGTQNPPTGQYTWINLLNSGWTKTEVLDRYRLSPEPRAILYAWGYHCNSCAH